MSLKTDVQTANYPQDPTIIRLSRREAHKLYALCVHHRLASTEAGKTSTEYIPFEDLLRELL